MTSRHFVLICGEPSGDQLCAELMAGMRVNAGMAKGSPAELTFSGVGGALAQQEGLRSVFPQEDIQIIGITQALARIFTVYARARELARHICATDPVLVVTIDVPDFSIRVAARARRMGWRGKMIHYVAPTVWIWRKGRARAFARYYDALLVLFPFETKLFPGIPTHYVGHPLLKRLDDFFRTTPRAVESSRPMLCLLPGSRRREVEKLLPFMIDVANNLVELVPDLTLVIPTIPERAPRVRALCEATLTGAFHIPTSEQERFSAFAQSHCALAAAGTVVTEATVALLPTITIYKSSKLNEWVGRRMLYFPSLTVVNILARQHLVSDYLNDDLDVQTIATELRCYLDPADGAMAREAWRVKIGAWHDALIAPSSVAPSDICLDYVSQ